MNKRLIACALACFLALLLPLQALGETEGRAWQLRFEVPAASEDKLITAISELLKVLSAEGTWAESEGSFDLNASFRLEGGSGNATAFRVYGNEAKWIVTSPLLANERLLFDQIALVEFGNKMNEHLQVPVNKLALLYPFAFRDAMAAPLAAIREVMRPGDVSPEALEALCRELAALAEEDRAFSHWLKALGGDSSLYQDIIGWLEELPAYLSDTAPEGITVTVSETEERWTPAGQPDAAPIWSCRTDGSAWALSLPALWAESGEEEDWDENAEGEEDWEENGWDEEEDWEEEPSEPSVDPAGGLYCAWTGTPGARGLTLRLGPDGSALQVLLLEDAESWQLSLSGAYLAEWTTLRCSVERGLYSELLGGRTWRLRLLREPGGWLIQDDETGTAMLRVRFTASPITAQTPVWSEADLNGTSFYSLADTSLRELIQRTYRTAVPGLLSLIADAPTVTVTATLDWLEDIGLLTEESSPFEAAP